MIKIYLVVLSFLCPFISFGQNISTEGLKSGYWVEDDDGSNYRLATGCYKIKSLSDYDIIRELTRNCYELKFGSSKALLFCFGKNENNISVKDSVWNYFDHANNLLKTEFYIDGINMWRKEYNEEGALVQSLIQDYKNDTVSYFYYIKDVIFKKAFYPSNDKNNQTVVYYPGSKLGISDAEPHFRINFLTTPRLNKEVTFTANDDVIIDSIISQQRFFEFTGSDNKKIDFPIKIQKGSNYKLIVSAFPSPADYTSRDTFSIFSGDSSEPYQIHAFIDAYHLSNSTVEKTRSIELSISIYQFLILPSMGTVTDAVIIDAEGNRHHYEIERITKIRLSYFKPGRYKLRVSSCDAGGQIEMVLKE